MRVSADPGRTKTMAAGRSPRLRTVWTLALAAGAAAALGCVASFQRFRARVRASLGATPDIRWQRWTIGGLAVTVCGFAVEADLTRAYLRWAFRSVPERALLDDLADALRRRVPPGPIPPFSLVRDRLLPVLKPSGALPPEHGYVRANILSRRALDEEISIGYVIEGPLGMTYITRGMLEVWGLTDGALHELAVENLRARTAHLLHEIGGPRRAYVALDGYDAARLLVGDLLAPRGIADPVFAIPHEHACLIEPAVHARELRDRSAASFGQSALRLTTALYRWTEAGPQRIGRDEHHTALPGEAGSNHHG